MQPSPPETAGRTQLVLTWILIPLTAILVVVIILLYVLYTTALVDGQSMFPTLHDADYLILERGYSHPARGDIIVYSGRNYDGTETEVIKRVIAIPGDTIEVDSGTAIVNGIREVCPDCVTIAQGDTSIDPLLVPEGHVFTMGDNRPVSLDGRHYGPIPIDAVKGEARFIFAPFSRIHRIDEGFGAE